VTSPTASSGPQPSSNPSPARCSSIWMLLEILEPSFGITASIPMHGPKRAYDAVLMATFTCNALRKTLMLDGLFLIVHRLGRLCRWSL